ncbi:MAG: AAA domain-containing protein [Verrucomicrobium sp.]
MILAAMLQRLFASLVQGPSMNARPHRSRQRCDWMDLASFQGVEPATALAALVEKRKVEFPAKVPPFSAPDYPEAEWSDEQKKSRDKSAGQAKLLRKLRDIAEDAREYINDHGESCLAVGFPLVSIPASAEDATVKGSARILAPLLLMPVDLQVRTTSRTGITLEAAGEGADLLVANPALIAWLERQSGKSLGEIFLDEEAADPWREVAELLAKVGSMLGLASPPGFTAESLLVPVPALEKLGKTVSVLPSAVLGLFPLSNQSLLKDTRWMMEQEPTLADPVASFLNPKALQDFQPDDPAAEEAGESPPTEATGKNRDFSKEWLVSAADPCQAAAVLASREARALVVHGPPGTGKSQTITNMIADHLARRERVLFVCDKRTALDVVKHRLDAAGLGDLCGVVHDPSGDRKDFYMGLRTQLENLADTPVPADPAPQLDSLNRQLGAIHAELESCRKKLHESPEPGAASFHELLGQWMTHAFAEGQAATITIPSVTPDEVESSRIDLDEICRHAAKSIYGNNPYRGLVGISLADFISRPASEITSALSQVVAAAKSADQLAPAAVVFPWGATDEASLVSQAELRQSLASQLRELAGSPALALVTRVLGLPETTLQAWRTEAGDIQTWGEQARQAPLDRALLSGARSAGLLNLAKANEHLVALADWEPLAGSFFKRLLAGAKKGKAAAALAPLGLTLKEGWSQGLAFYRGVKTRLLLADWLERAGEGTAGSLEEDGVLLEKTRALALAWQIQETLTAQGGSELGVKFKETASTPVGLQELAGQLEKEAGWGLAVRDVLRQMSSTQLFNSAAPAKVLVKWLTLESPAAELAGAWLTQRGTLEDVVRLQQTVAKLPGSMQSEAERLASAGVDNTEMLACFRKAAVENTLRNRLKQDTALAALDGERIEASFQSLLDHSQEKLLRVREHIRHQWLRHQRQRLLALTGSQLNKAGAALRQRLYVRGKKALKLRQMLATGEESEGGDPLFDLCPVWMASPSTVAQIFARRAIFDVVIFDEASQCRLEEALPVLLRGHRVVIVGDQKQLPPTRFFESALADSGDSDAETAEELFYQQQQDAEDLLSAALNLEVREAYLDVHYRSRNEDLIGFSNQRYYGSRLQPIPGHPKNKALAAPIQVHRVDGLYEDRTNVKEAQAAVALVAELLAEAEPPSIGLACFNLTQRDAILDALEELAEQNPAFASRLAEARKRKGHDSFEGLFVKNLENVQGDERDVMIICTTFGNDAKGKFRRNFGALSQREGGRRLNVLVTRARTAVHVFTSIPAAEYRHVEPVPPGQTPNGRLQLYAYLRYAETLTETFTKYQDELEKMQRDSAPELKHWPTATPSALASSFGEALLAKHSTGAHVNWGNEGFCVDVACIHPVMPADVTVGVLTDFSRFHKTPDLIEWDLFRTRVLRGQGWELQRHWSPSLFRKSEEILADVAKRHLEVVAGGQ